MLLSSERERKTNEQVHTIGMYSDSELQYRQKHHIKQYQVASQFPKVVYMILQSNPYILSRAICRGAPQIRWRKDCTMEMAKNGWGSLNLSNTTYEYQLSRPR